MKRNVNPVKRARLVYRSGVERGGGVFEMLIRIICEAEPLLHQIKTCQQAYRGNNWKSSRRTEF